MKKRYRWLSLLMAFVLIAGLSACSDDEDYEDDSWKDMEDYEDDDFWSVLWEDDDEFLSDLWSDDEEWDESDDFWADILEDDDLWLEDDWDDPNEKLSFLDILDILLGGNDEIVDMVDKDRHIQEVNDPDDTWAIYWYLCGSDLESDYGAATADLLELQEVTLPENVKVVIQTGGARNWYHEDITPGRTGRYLYGSNGLELIEEEKKSNMGSARTLAEFLVFCEQNYPADHKMLLFWDHGGGTNTGVSYDEIYNFDYLSLDEIYEALSRVYNLGKGKPPFEVVGFDTCLMATIDTAAMLKDVSNYMVASQEMEPGCGWQYNGWVQLLGNHPGMDGAELGRMICDTYMEGCEAGWMEDEATLSVVDLRKLDDLLVAYDNMGKEALMLACQKPKFLAEFGRRAAKSENYGGNTPDQGYSNMVDLGHLVRNSQNLLPRTAQAVLQGLDDCVVYKVGGSYRQQATGLSCYYSYDGNVDELEQYVRVSASPSFSYLYDYALTGYLDEEGLQYASNLGYKKVQKLTGAKEYGLDDHPLYLDDDGYVILDVGAEAASALEEVNFLLNYISTEDDLILSLGRDNDMDSDWEQGKFCDNFRGVWGAIDDHLCYMELVQADETYNLYSVPILLDDESYNLRVAYNFDTEEYSILGARRAIDDNGMADKIMRQLRPGDQITTIHYAMSISGDDDLRELPVETFTVTEDTSFGEVDMGDGLFVMLFEMTDYQGNKYLSQAGFFDVEDGEIYSSVEE